MFYILSKIFYFFLVPLNWILVLLLCWFFAKKPHVKKRFGIAALIVFVLFSNKVLFTMLVNEWQPEPVKLNTSQRFSAGILLGGYASFDAKGRGYFNEAADRFIQATKLYKQGSIQKIIVSGNTKQDTPSDENFVENTLLTMGVPAQDIIVENTSKNTFENATFSKRLIDSARLQPPYVLITSAMHMPRSLEVFDKVGLKVVPYPSNYSVLKYKPSLPDYLFPSADVLSDWAYFIKEIAGILAYSLTNKA